MIERRIHWAATAVAGFLGVAHIALTPFLYPDALEASLWFAGAGLAVVLAALLNLQALLQRSGPRAPLLLGNMATAVFFALVSFLLREPQMFVGLATFLALTITSRQLDRPQA